MTVQLPDFLGPAGRRLLPRAAAFVILTGAAFAGGGIAPAAAQSMSWEEGCAMRMVTPGSGDILRTMNCDRQKMCQQMANAKGGMMMGMGCFGVEPKTPAPAAQQTGRARPVQKQ
jgi:hypothetical protein